MIPRIPDDKLAPQVAAALRPRVERLGYLGEFFRCAKISKTSSDDDNLG